MYCINRQQFAQAFAFCLAQVSKETGQRLLRERYGIASDLEQRLKGGTFTQFPTQRFLQDLANQCQCDILGQMEYIDRQKHREIPTVAFCQNVPGVTAIHMGGLLEELHMEDMREIYTLYTQEGTWLAEPFYITPDGAIFREYDSHDTAQVQLHGKNLYEHIWGEFYIPRSRDLDTCLAYYERNPQIETYRGRFLKACSGQLKLPTNSQEDGIVDSSYAVRYRVIPKIFPEALGIWQECNNPYIAPVECLFEISPSKIVLVTPNLARPGEDSLPIAQAVDYVNKMYPILFAIGKEALHFADGHSVNVPKTGVPLSNGFISIDPYTVHKGTSRLGISYQADTVLDYMKG